MGPEEECPLMDTENLLAGGCRSQGLARNPRRLAALLALVAAAALGIAGWRWSAGLDLPRPLGSRSAGIKALFGLAGAQAGAPGMAYEAWEVVWESGVNVRSQKAFTAPVLRVQKLHDVVRGHQEGNWLRVEGDRGFLAIAAPQSGTLLKKIQPSQAVQPVPPAAPPVPPVSPVPQAPPATPVPPAPPATPVPPAPPAKPPAPPAAPHGPPAAPFAHPVGPPAGSCRTYGCTPFDPTQTCQCNPQCYKHGTCCSDYHSFCRPAPAPPGARQPLPATCEPLHGASGPAQCFCHLAGNPGCAGSPCPCQQGCSGVTWTSGLTVTFKNLANARGCPIPTALLTIPKWYFADIQSLRTGCPARTVAYLSDMMLAGFQHYQTVVRPGPVKQCIHAAGATSQAWLHIHTICAGGSVDKMFRTGKTNWCGIVSSVAQVRPLAQQMAAWAARIGLPRR